MQLSHTWSEEMLGKIKKSWGKLREVMGQICLFVDMVDSLKCK